MSFIPFPSDTLPPVKKVLNLSTAEMSRLIEYLAEIYTPRVLGSQFLPETDSHPSPTNFRDINAAKKSLEELPVDNRVIPTDALASSGLDTSPHIPPDTMGSPNDAPNTKAQQLDTLLADDFERSFVFRWLTGVIACSEEWISRGMDEEGISTCIEKQSSGQTRESVTEHASSLLAACSGTSSSGNLTRTFIFSLDPNVLANVIADRTHSNDNANSIDCLKPTDVAALAAPIQIHLKDASVPSQDIDAVGLQTWGSAPVLAQLIANCPSKYGFHILSATQRLPNQASTKAFKVLELGAGTGLISLFIWKLLERLALVSFGHAEYSVVATDFHSTVIANMVRNIRLNFSTSISVSSVHETSTALSSSTPEWSTSAGGVKMEARHLDWAYPPCLSETEKYDLIFGVDIVYEKGHAELVRNAVEATLRKPNPAEEAVNSADRDETSADGSGDLSDCGGVFWLIYPLRPTHNYETKSIEHVFGDMVPSPSTGKMPAYRKRSEWTLGVLSKEIIERRKGIGRADEITYHILKIGWVLK